MEDTSGAHVNTLEEEIVWTVSFFQKIQNLQHQNSVKVKSVQTLIKEFSQMTPSTRELITR